MAAGSVGLPITTGVNMLTTIEQTGLESGELTRHTLLLALEKFVLQRPGLDPNDYGSASSYRAELRSITRDLHDFRRLLRGAWWRSAIDVEALLNASRRAYSGRLSFKPLPGGACAVEYVVGQYFPTEYRKAGCAVLASALRDNLHQCMSDAAARRAIRVEFGRGIAARWFN